MTRKFTEKTVSMYTPSVSNTWVDINQSRQYLFIEDDVKENLDKISCLNAKVIIVRKPGY